MKKKAILQQISREVEKYNNISNMHVPTKGWIKAIRTAIGMRSNQLATLLKVSQAQVSKYEKEENQGAITIKTMKKIAKALQCKFYYGFIPAKSLEDIVHKQAEKVAKAYMFKAGHNMMLEKQDLSKEEKKQLLNDFVEDIKEKLPRTLWEDE